MGYRGSFFILTSIVALALSLSACDGTPYEISTINYQADGEGWIKFSTNDDALLNKSFIHIPSDIGNSFAPSANWTSPATIQVKKNEGSALSGFGLVFAYEDSETYFALLITMSGKYKILQKLSGSFVLDSGWTQSSAIHGWELVNELKVNYTHTPSDGDTVPYFELWINGSQLSAGSGTWPERLHLPSGLISATKAGFFTGVFNADAEKFPKYTSDQRFKLTSPVIYP
jgi:hypothetical protein